MIGYSRPAKRSQRKFAVRGGRRATPSPAPTSSTRDGVSPQLIAGRDGRRRPRRAARRDDAPLLRAGEGIEPAGLHVLGHQVKPAVNVRRRAARSFARREHRPRRRPPRRVDRGPGRDRPGRQCSAARRRDAYGRRRAGDARGRDPGHGRRAGTDRRGRGHLLRARRAPARRRAAAYPFLLSSRSVTSVEPANGTSVQVRIAEADSPDTGDAPDRQVPRGTGFPVVDGAGNDAAEGLAELGGRGCARAACRRRLRTTTLTAGSTARRFASRRTSSTRQSSGSSRPSRSAGYQVTGAGAADATGSLGSASWRARARTRVRRPPSRTTGTASRTCATPPANLALNSSVSRRGRRRAAGPAVACRTADVDDDGRIDRLASTWSEPLVHADDTSAPFAVSASELLRRSRAGVRSAPTSRST